MELPIWIQGLNVAVTVTDKNGKIIYMNDKSQKTFANYGGAELIGKDLGDCHSQRSNDIIKQLIESGKTNAYTIEKNGIKKLIYQSPWIENGEHGGMIELSIEIPLEMPHFVRS